MDCFSIILFSDVHCKTSMLKERAGGQNGVVMVSPGPDLYLLMPTVISSHSSMHILLIKDSKFPQGECKWCVFDEQWNT